MRAEILERRAASFVEAEPGPVMVVTTRFFQHWTVRVDEDARPHVLERPAPWYGCQLRVEEGSALEQALRELGR